MYTLSLYRGYVMITYTDGTTYIDYTYLLVFLKGIHLIMCLFKNSNFALRSFLASFSIKHVAAIQHNSFKKDEQIDNSISQSVVVHHTKPLTIKIYLIHICFVEIMACPRRFLVIFLGFCGLLISIGFRSVFAMVMVQVPADNENVSGSSGNFLKQNVRIFMHFQCRLM